MKMKCKDCGRIFNGYASERFCLFCHFHGADTNPAFDQLVSEVISE